MSDPAREEALVQLVRALRISTMHALGNEAVHQAVGALVGALDALSATQSNLQLEVFERSLYLDREFLELRQATFEAAEQLVALFSRLGIDEMVLQLPLTPGHVHTFLEAFQAHALGQSAGAFAALRHPRITVRVRERQGPVHTDRHTALARTYAQLLVLTQEAFAAHEQGLRVRVVLLRRGTQELVEGAHGLENLLVGLATHVHAEPTPATRAVGAAALALLMGRRLAATRAMQVELTLAALLHRLGDPGATQPLPRRALQSGLALAELGSGAAAIDRAAIALELGHTSASGEGPLAPGVPARLLAVAATYQDLVQVPPGTRGLPPDQAVRRILDRAGTDFDRRAARLFVQVVGLYPPGSLVLLSNGAEAVVVASDPGAPTRPTVRRLGDDALVELAHHPQVTIRQSLDPRVAAVNVTHFLLA